MDNNKINLSEFTEEELSALSKQLSEEKSSRREAAQQKALAEKKEKEAKLLSERKDRAKEVEDAFKAAKEADNKANDLLRAFVRDYGSWHCTFSGTDTIPTFSSWVERFCQDFFNF